MCLPKLDIYQGTLALNCFKSHTNSFFFVLFFFKKKEFCLMSGLGQRNIVSTGQSVWDSKKNYIQSWLH